MVAWRTAQADDTPLEALEELSAYLLHRRGISTLEHASFLEPNYERDVHDPGLLFSMSEALDLIHHAIKHNERILIHGDYDADGITSTAILMTALTDSGAHVIPYLPHRLEEGYGINQQSLEALLESFDVFISVDCGISSVAEVAWLRQQGKHVIIIDHHEFADTLPEAHAILHPRHPQGAYPFKYLSGAGMAWKFASAVATDKRFLISHQAEYEKMLLDLACLGTLADAVPLLGENRAIVRFGQHVLQRSPRPGLKALRQVMRLDGPLSSEDIVFRMVPLLNAPGRLDHAQPALDVLLAKTDARAAKAAEKVHRMNQQRQTLTRRILADAEAHISLDEAVIVAANPAWPAGLAGIAASRLSRQHGRPAVVIGGAGQHAIGSARSPKGMNILEALQAVQAHTVRVGGHAQAAGLTLEVANIGAFKEALQQYFSDRATTRLPQMPEAEAVVAARLLDWSTLDLLDKFEPFGQDNPRPTFIVKRLPLVDMRPVGKTASHLKCTFQVGDTTLDGIGFDLAKQAAKISRYCDVLGTLEVNMFRGQRSLQLRLEAIAQAGTVQIERTAAVAV